MLENGFGEHNIQGIGDKHIPLIHNVMNTDVVVAVSDRATDELDVLFNTEAGRRYLVDRRGVARRRSSTRSSTSASRRSATCSPRSRRRSCSASVPTTPSITVATDGAAPVRERASQDPGRALRRTFGDVDAAEVFAEHLGAAGTDHVARVHRADRTRIFNLGYYTWVEQQGTPLDVFEARRSQRFWRELRRLPAGVGRADRRLQRARGDGRRAVIDRLPLCGLRRRVAVATPLAVAVPRTPTAADRHHVLVPRRGRPRRCDPVDDPNPLVGASTAVYAWAAFAAAHGMGADDRAAGPLASTQAVTAVDGVGFVVTPFARSPAPVRRLGFSPRRRRAG